jgi:hypothetical protein
MNTDELAQLEAQYDFSTIEGFQAFHAEIERRQILKDLETHQRTFEREYEISKENWENTTFTVKVVMIQMWKSLNQYAETEEEVRNWLEDCPI